MTIYDTCNKTRMGHSQDDIISVHNLIIQPIIGILYMFAIYFIQLFNSKMMYTLINNFNKIR